MAKYILAQIMIESQLRDIIAQSDGENVTVNISGENKTLSAALAQIITDISALPTGSDVDAKLSAAIDEIIGGASGTYDTLKEIESYIVAHEHVVTALNAAIGNKVDKADGMGLSAENFTAVLKSKLESLKLVEASGTNGNIKIDGQETTVYTHPSGEGSAHIPAGGTAGQVLTRTASGYEFADAPAEIHYGSAPPADMKNGHMFVRVVS